LTINVSLVMTIQTKEFNEDLFQAIMKLSIETKSD